LDWQKTQNQLKTEIEKDMTEGEKQMLNAHWQLENEKER